MTALVFYIEPDQLCIAMDTRTTGIDDDTGDRILDPFCSKMFLVPHLRAVICGTGLRALPFYWHAFIQQRTVVRSIEDLDRLAALTLPDMADGCGVDDEVTATIYHFGYSERARGFIGRAFRSTDGFQAEPLIVPGFGVKPPEGIGLDPALGLCESMGLPDGMIEVMKRQKAFDDGRPPNERLGIGGEVQFLVMTPEETRLRTVHRFGDYERDLAELLARACREHDAG